jgi:sugar lactone lactonase YvrE
MRKSALPFLLLPRVGGNRRTRRFLQGSAALITFALLVPSGCGGDQGPPPLTTGSLKVQTVTSGSDLDPDGYTVTIGTTSQSIGTNASVTVRDLSVDTHAVQLSGVELNCDVAGANPRDVSVTTGATTETTFAVDCLAAGTVEVTISTSGEPADPDGYALWADGSLWATTGVDSTVSLTVSAGDYSLELGDLAGNCEVSSPTPQVISVSIGATVAASFQVACENLFLDQIVFVRQAQHQPSDIHFGDIYVIDPDGANVRQLTNTPQDDDHPAVSPDGTKLLFDSDRSGDHEIYVMNADGSTLVNLTGNAATDEEPAWSPDGQKIAFVSDRDDTRDIYTMNPDGSGVARLTNSALEEHEPEWRPPAGDMIVYWTGTSHSVLSEIYVMNAEGTGVTRLTDNSHPDGTPAWSPDGSRIAFTSWPALGLDIWLMNPDGSGLTEIGPSPRGDIEPAWSADGRIAYTQAHGDSPAQGELMVMNSGGGNVVRLTYTAPEEERRGRRGSPQRRLCRRLAHDAGARAEGAERKPRPNSKFRRGKYLLMGVGGVVAKRTRVGRRGGVGVNLRPHAYQANP